MSRPNHIQFLSSSDEDEEPPVKKSIFDSMKRSENNSKPKPKHIVFVDSSDDEKEPSVSKLRFDSTIDYESKSVKKKKKRSRDETPIDSIVERSRSDSTKKSKKNSDEKKGSSTKDLAQVASIVDKSKSDSRKKSKKKSDEKEESPINNKDFFRIDLIVMKSNSDSTKKNKKNYDQNRKLSVEEASPIDTVVHKSIYDSTKMSKDKISDQKKETFNDEVSHGESVVKRSRSDSTISNEKNLSDDVDQNEESSSEDVSQIESVKKVNPYEKRNETLLKCPICKEFSSFVVSTLRTHLRYKHSTTLGLAGVYLHCDCGHEAQSDKHLRECKIANYTVIRKKDGPIQTYHDKKVTPQCILCEAYPRTAQGYSGHLVDHHQTNLKAIRRYLICSCGYKVTSNFLDTSHKKKCDGRKYTLHKLNEK